MRNTVEDPTVPKRTPTLSRENSNWLQCGCDGGDQAKLINLFGRHFHLAGCKVGANAIRLHDELVSSLARLFRSLRIDAMVEPIRLFAEASGANLLLLLLLLLLILILYLMLMK